MTTASQNLSAYTPVMWAQESLVQLQQALGMANRVHRGYDRERATHNKGDTITIRKPSTFTAQDAPSSTPQDMAPEETELKLTHWKDVLIAIRDDQRVYTFDQLVDEHIQPAGYALARHVDTTLNALTLDIPWTYQLNATPGSVMTDLTGPHQILFDNGVMTDLPKNMHYEIDGKMQAGLLANSTIGSWNGAGPDGVAVQRSGILGEKFGMNFFANQNIKTYATGLGGADVTGTLTGTPAAGSKTIAIGAVTASVTGILVAGDTFTIAGQLMPDGRLRTFVVTSASVNSDGGGAIASVAFEPGLPVAGVNGSVVTLQIGNGTQTRRQLPVFHRNAFAFAMARLPEVAEGEGARTASILDDKTGLAIRATTWYEGKEATRYVRLDILYGVKTLDRDMCVRAWYV